MSLDIGNLQAENERLSSANTGYMDQFVQMPEGNGMVVVRLLAPAPAGMFDRQKSPFYVATRTHRVNGRSYHCPRELEGGRWRGKCPICDYYNKLWQDSKLKATDVKDAMEAEARSIKPIERYYYNAMIRQQVNPQTNEVEKDLGPKILSIGKMLHQMIIRAIVGSEELGEKPLGDITDVQSGRDFKIIKTMRKSGDQSFPEYSQSKFLDPSPLGSPDQVQAWMPEVLDLVALRTVKEYEFLHKQVRIHIGMEKDEETGFDPHEFGSGNGQAKEAEVATVTTVEPATETAAPDAEAPTTVEVAPTQTEEVAVEAGGQTESIADEDFLAELQAMGDQ